MPVSTAAIQPIAGTVHARAGIVPVAGSPYTKPVGIIGSAVLNAVRGHARHNKDALADPAALGPATEFLRCRNGRMHQG